MSALLHRAQSRGHSQAMQPPSSLTVQATGRQAFSISRSCRLCSRSRAFPPGLWMFKCQYGQPAVQGRLVSSKAPGLSHAMLRALLAPPGVVKSQSSLDIRMTLQPGCSGSPRSRNLSTFPTSESGAQQNSMITGLSADARHAASMSAAIGFADTSGTPLSYSWVAADPSPEV